MYESTSFWIWPLFIVCFAVIYDCISLIHVPKSLFAITSFLAAPFRNFLTPDEMANVVKKSLLPSVVAVRVLPLLAISQVALWLACLIYALVVGDAKYALECAISTTSWLYVSLRIIMMPPLVAPITLTLFAALNAFVALLNLGNAVLQSSLGMGAVQIFFLCLSLLFAYAAGTLPLLEVSFATTAQDTDIPSVKLSSPEDDVTLWSWSTFSFIEPIFGVQGRLNDTDVWSLSPLFLHKNLFNKRLEYQSRHPTHSLLHFLLVSNSLDLILDFVLELWSAVMGFVPPYALKEILAALADRSPESRNRAYYWTIVTFLVHLSFGQVDLFQSFYTRRCYERTRGQLFCALHYKALKREDVSGKIEVEGQENASANLGKIVNLMQGDSYAVSQRFWEMSALFTSPIRLVIALVFLYQILGWSSLFGVAVVLLAYVLNYPLAKYNVSLTRSGWKARDARMDIVTELLQNIRFLKFYGWEYKWAQKSSEARETELKWRVKQNVVNALISFIWTWIPSATALSAFLCYTLIAKERLTVSKAFTALALFSQLQGPMTELPGQIFALLNAYVSMQRIEHFLKEDEVPEWASTLTATVSPHPGGLGFANNAIFQHARPTSGPSSPRFRLGPLNITFPEGISLVTGPTGSGKTALLGALLGEMHCLSGEVFITKTNHQVAYCAQNPWLEHATIRDNIIFGAAYGYDEARYKLVIESCALVRDLEVFEAGDLTEIGEKGITLSGGQRQRIALARALYSAAKYILLDDPLSAVDMHTAQHLVAHCLSGELVRGRSIILVTHHLSLCIPIAKYVVELFEGTVLRSGSSEETGLIQKVIQSEDINYIDQEISEETSLENEADKLSDKRNGAAPAGKSTGKLIEEEARAEGRVSLHTYLVYMRAAGTISWMLTFILMVLIRILNIVVQVFLAAWGEAYEEKYPAIAMISSIRYPWEGLPSPDVNVTPWLLVYLYISLAGAFSILALFLIGYYASLQASRSLFISLLWRITRAPARFFDVTPIGRILNRFTTDINTIDGTLQNSARQCMLGILNFLASFLVILAIVPSFAPAALFIAWLYIRLAPPYIEASRDLRRLESVSLSPAFAGFDELLRGITHVRAFGMEQRYQNGFYAKVDKFQSFDHVYWLVNGWLRWRYDCLGSLVVFATTIFALWNETTDGATAIVIVQAGIFAEASRQLVKVAAQLELDFNSVERVVEYLEVPQEAPAIVENSRPPAYWPSSTGSLSLEKLTIKYAPDLPPALKSLSFTINPSEKIGVVGRTGSGKSTLALSLLRMLEASEGAIIIDGIDISTIGLEDLRTRITIVSQDVSLFSGTIRSNMDPLGEHTDEECLDVLSRCHMDSVLRYSDMGRLLDLPISQGSLSGGERQLVALARAILRRTNIIVMDEATSQIDSNLDDKIQRTIREELAGAIVITIAHRLKTIIDYDRILLLDDGMLLESGSPRELLKKPSGAFREMCRKSPDWDSFVSLVE
ncbi:pleiotropic drug resistance ABC transporter [Mycena floridula]|nr:pleiotropic drug resistance ABC transporter [Mycena floridula]